MSKLAEFRELEKHLAEQLAALETLKGDSGLQREIEFEQKLRELLAEYSYSLRNIVALLDPNASTRRGPVGLAAPEKITRRARQIKQYTNPHTSEVIETKGGNHKQLKEWKAEYGAETVESWLKA
ncbi:histone-like nucleoid-structuring protein, MvaT/MvaU family [Pseudomonas sp. G.S.17]|uniref:histone-like nucleoid-structuring protein, MvaT/MvaU family n=1 Tax=Pseudomonas sp. G.S.17 TaxID=3137451 RepID=UPI00311CCAC3